MPIFILLLKRALIVNNQKNKFHAYFKSIYLAIYHGPHLWTILPFLIFLACPLMHMMHHHGKHKEADKSQKDKKNNNHKGCH